jgi:hypothetical protein
MAAPATSRSWPKLGILFPSKPIANPALRGKDFTPLEHQAERTRTRTGTARKNYWGRRERQLTNYDEEERRAGRMTHVVPRSLDGGNVARLLFASDFGWVKARTAKEVRSISRLC